MLPQLRDKKPLRTSHTQEEGAICSVRSGFVLREGVEPPQPKPLVYSQLPSPMGCLRRIGDQFVPAWRA